MSTSTSSTTRSTKIHTTLFLKPLRNRQWAVYGQYPDGALCAFTVDTALVGEIIIPAGFTCDLNSIPRFLWWVSTPTDYPEAGVVHDWAYRGALPRDLADRVYAELLTHLGMAQARVAGRYMALRTFGWSAYKGPKR